MNVVSTLDIAPTVLSIAGLKPLESFQGVSFLPTLTGQTEPVREYAFAEHNWHDYQAFERAVHSDRYCYVRNWLPNTAGTPPADAVRSPTFASMQALDAKGQLHIKIASLTLRSPRPEEFLYDVTLDPQCVANLATDRSHNSVLKRMRAALDAWQKETGDAFPGKDKLTPDGFDRNTGKKLIKKSHPSFK